MNASILRSKVLVIESDPATADLIRAALAKMDAIGWEGDLYRGIVPFDMEWVRQVPEGLERLGKEDIAAILLDLRLPDGHGIETFDKVQAAAPDVPILILADNATEDVARHAVLKGAQDYLPPDRLDSYSLARALRSAIERKTVEDALYAERERAIVTLNSIGDAVLSTDRSGNITYLNAVAEKMTGWPKEEAVGQPLAKVFRIVDGVSRQTSRDPMEMAVQQNRTVGLTVNCILIRRDGAEFPIEDSAAPIHDRVGRIVGAVIVFHDVSVARALSGQMTYAAQHDLLTGLPNRLLLNDRLSQSIQLARRHNKPIALMFLDLDNFKYVNDSLGHAIGDQLLQSVSRRLVASVRASDTVSRQGGDEFVILLSEIAYAEDVATSARKLLLSIGICHSIAGRDLHIDGSIGISVFPEDGDDAETLIKNADTAMYSAKGNGRNNFQFFTVEMNRKAVERQSLEASLRGALSADEFVLDYQPTINLDSGEITGVEALIRWHHPKLGLMSPGQFVPIAVDCGLIIPIGRWVMREACRQARAWQKAGLPRLTISVNVSAPEFRDIGFVAGVRAILAETGLEARYLELELTEGVLMEAVVSTDAKLLELKAMGVHLAIDDFGTGYSSLSYLRQFPVDVLKIDQSFVHQITADADDSSIVGAIINMGRSMKHVVIAEGIETAGQRDFLHARHCAEGQGYLFSRPVAAAQFAHMLEVGLRGVVLH
jgi:diguanylate cyclase (GGDEF)-like protein/PAS domain S-box-containing protein